MQRPTFAIPLDASLAAADDIALRVKGKQKIGKTPRAATAQIDHPRRNNRRLNADIRVSAEPNALGTAVLVFACIAKKDKWAAGSYEGTVTVYGPRFSEFSYPLVVTTKWPAWIPIAIIVGVLLVFLFFEVRRTETGLAGDGILIAIGVLAGAATYFAQYDSVETWGDSPPVQLGGLAVAVVTAAAAGRAAAKRYFTKPT